MLNPNKRAKLSKATKKIKRMLIKLGYKVTWKEARQYAAAKL